MRISEQQGSGCLLILSRDAEIPIKLADNVPAIWLELRPNIKCRDHCKYQPLR